MNNYMTECENHEEPEDDDGPVDLDGELTEIVSAWGAHAVLAAIGRVLLAQRRARRRESAFCSEEEAETTALLEAHLVLRCQAKKLEELDL